MIASVRTNNSRTMIVRLAAGALAGAVAGSLFLGLAKAYLPFGNPAGMAAAGTGLVYLLMGIFVALGAAVPRAGAHFLNVEDAEELNEQRLVLIYSSGSCILTAAVLLVLALSAPGAEVALLSRTASACIAGICLAGAVWTGLRTIARSDELMRQVGLEASAFSLHAAMFLFCGWAALAHFGLVQWIEPLALISGFAIIQLVAVFWISGRKGMLKQR